MRTNYVPPHQTTPLGMHGHSNPGQSQVLRIKHEDFEHQIVILHPDKRAYARSLFPMDSSGRHRMIDEKGFNSLKGILSKTERETFTRAMEEYNPSINFGKPNPNGRMSEAKTAKLKDTSRFTEETPPQANRPAKGEDLKTPIGSHGEGPKIGPRDEDLYPPLGPKPTQDKTNPESAKPTSMTLADLLAKDKPNEKSNAGQTSHVSHQSQTPTPPKRVHWVEEPFVQYYQKGQDAPQPPPKGGLKNPNQTPTPPKRVRFNEQPQVHEFVPSQDSPHAPMSMTKKVLLGGGVALAGATALAGFTTLGVFAFTKTDDPSPSTPAGT